ncbi:uncharacterized protein [Anoplolepis gracilipes]|uniref:uncharacterized protein n=1 Tax=Anoplolepis gracilipes TaxID=354296 RepID=UPI003BA20A1D
MPYDSTDFPPQQIVKDLVTHAESKGLELLLGCDPNSHHTEWGRSGVNPREESLHEFIMGSGLIIFNRGIEPTFIDSRRQEVIDITICTDKVAGLISDWRVSNKPSGSDHRSIHLSLRHNPDIVWSRNPRKTNWEGYRMDLKVRLGKAPNKFHNKDDLKMVARFISDTIVDAYEFNCPMKRKRLSTKVPLWNKELSKLRSEVRKSFNKARKTDATTHWETFRSSQRKYSKAIVSDWKDRIER